MQLFPSSKTITQRHLLKRAWRAGWINGLVVIGVSSPAYSAWQKLLMFSILFHHSNVELPIELERWLSRISSRLVARRPSFDRSRRDRLELVERVNAVRLVTWNLGAQCTAASNHHRRACLPAKSGCEPWQDYRHVVHKPAAQLTLAGKWRAEARGFAGAKQATGGMRRRRSDGVLE